MARGGGRRSRSREDRLSDEAPTPEPEGAPKAEPKRVTRREALKKLGSSGATLLGAGMVVGAVGSHAAAHAQEPGQSSSHTMGGPYDASASDRLLSSELVVGSDAGPYGGIYSPPLDMSGSELDSITSPPPALGGRGDGVIELEMTVTERTLRVARDLEMVAWTYNGSSPGPTIRATEGDRLRIHFKNATEHDHNLHFHGRHTVAQDGWEPVPPHGETTYEIVAGPAGVHPYHCHTMPIDYHIAKGLYGALIVDPVGGRPVARELVMVISGWDVNEDGRNEVYTFNGIAGYYEKFPIKVEVGAPVRLYLLNMVEYDPVASFHLHAEMFDVYPAGAGSAPLMTTDVVTLGQAERAILEFSLPERGRYMFHPHHHSMAGRGAMGWFSAI
jgi:FtsP/CotA-like multicopper oxidase with cupredoxin domain